MISAVCIIFLISYIAMNWEEDGKIIALLFAVIFVAAPIVAWLRQSKTKEHIREDEISKRLDEFRRKYGKPDMVVNSTCSEPRFFALFSKYKILVINNIEIPFSAITSYKLEDKPYEVRGDYEDYDDYDDIGYTENDYSAPPWCTQNSPTAKRKRKPRKHRSLKVERPTITIHHYILYANLNLEGKPMISIEVGSEKHLAKPFEDVFKSIIQSNEADKLQVDNKKQTREI